MNSSIGVVAEFLQNLLFILPQSFHERSYFCSFIGGRSFSFVECHDTPMRFLIQVQAAGYTMIFDPRDETIEVIHDFDKIKLSIHDDTPCQWVSSTPLMRVFLLFSEYYSKYLDRISIQPPHSTSYPFCFSRLNLI